MLVQAPLLRVIALPRANPVRAVLLLVLIWQLARGWRGQRGFGDVVHLRGLCGAGGGVDNGIDERLGAG